VRGAGNDQIVFQTNEYHAVFPLTPAISLGENGFQRHGKPRTASCAKGFGFYEVSQRLCLLPWGAGLDEGESAECLSGHQFCKLDLKIRSNECD
jgi:hypothetical protein